MVPSPPSQRLAPLRPEPHDPARIRRRFHRGAARPRGVVWFGVRSFWGHLRHLVASAIATEDIDSRDWMTADEPREFLHRIATELRAPHGGESLTARLGRDAWIDFVADTGDDAGVSGAVAGLLFHDYELPDPDRPGATLHAPRGDILLFGGDTAYPVATADEIQDRVITPFNAVLGPRADGTPRVLLGIPGNHDWYDGLDGFVRMFRRRIGDRAATRRTAGPRRTTLDRMTSFAREFISGGHVEKPRTLELLGYTPVQGASYFVLPVAPAIDILAVDRQLRAIDPRQQQFFLSWLNQRLGTAPVVVLPDPVYAFGEPSVTGTGMIRSLGLTLEARAHLVLSGDIHQYRRDRTGPTVHVTAGGGGAFLHPARMAGGATLTPEVAFPGVAESRALLRGIPFKVALGRSGTLPHWGAAALSLPGLVFAAEGNLLAALVTWPVVFVLATVPLALLGGAQPGKWRPVAWAALAGLVLGGLPVGLGLLAGLLGGFLPSGWSSAVPALASLPVASMLGAFVFGTYLALLTARGIDHFQAFAGLDHPGFKHFVRLRVRADGSAIDGFTLGLVDPMAPDARPVLVDRFTWRAH